MLSCVSLTNLSYNLYTYLKKPTPPGRRNSLVAHSQHNSYREYLCQKQPG